MSGQKFSPHIFLAGNNALILSPVTPNEPITFYIHSTYILYLSRLMTRLATNKAKMVEPIRFLLSINYWNC